MNIVKKRISLILSIIMLAMVIVPVININAATCQVTMTAKIGNTTMVNNGRYNVKGGEQIVISAKSSVSSIAFIGYRYDDTPVSQTVDVRSDKLTIVVPNKPNGTETTLKVEAVAANDDGSVNTVTKTGWYHFVLVYPKTTTTPSTETKKDVNVKLGSTTLKSESTTTTKAGATLTLTATPSNNVKRIAYKWNDEEGQSIYSSTGTLTIPTGINNGTTYRLRVNVEYNDGSILSGSTNAAKVYYFKAESSTSTVTNKDVNVKLGSTTLKSESTTTTKAGATLTLTATPSNNVKRIAYKWNDEEGQSIYSSTGTLTIPTGINNGTTYRLRVNVEYNDGSILSGSTNAAKVYYFKAEATPVKDNGKLELEPWMEENEEIEELSISLRNDSEEENKANKNIYALDEVVTYYIDYKNGGKDITSDVSIKLKLPLEFKAVSLDGGKINSDNEIEWNFANGLKEGEADTLVVKVKYTKLKKSRDDANTIYPTAKIYKASKLKDVSSVINFIITSYDEEIKIKHEPYMYGDADADTFRPDYLITRAEGALVLARIYGLDYENIRTITTKYTDIDTTYLEAQKAITAASQAGLINGYLEDDGTYTYRPNTKMTKAEFMKILACMIQESAEDADIDGLEIKELSNLVKVYDDSTRYYVVNGKKVYTHWAIEEITLLARLNMLPLTEDKPEFELDEKITRAEVAQLINFYLLRAPAKVTTKTKTGFSDVSRKHSLVGDIVEATRGRHTFSITEDALEVEE